MAREAIAYVLKGYPRLSETFIASEIHRLEQTGLDLRLFVIKPRDEEATHPVVEAIRATPSYLPPTTVLTGTPLLRWLATNLGPFLPAVGRVVRRRPVGLLRAAAVALSQAVRARRTFWSAPRALYLKELLLAVSLADLVYSDPRVGHLHAHFAHGATTVTWLASTITGVPFSFTGHAKDIYAPSLNPAGLLSRKLAAARFAVTCTLANGRHLRLLAPEADVHVVYHGLNADLARLLAQPAAPPSVDGRLRLLAVGRLVRKKGHDTVVEACDVLRRLGVDFEAVIVGEDGDQSGALRRRIDELGLGDRIRVDGPLRQEELLGEYRRATVFCLSSRLLDDGDRDGIPNVLVEAMAVGVPVVSTDVSAIPELVEDRATGLLVPPDDPAALAKAVLELHEDGELASRLSRQAKDVVRQRFDGDRLVRRLADLFADGNS